MLGLPMGPAGILAKLGSLFSTIGSWFGGGSATTGTVGGGTTAGGAGVAGTGVAGAGVAGVGVAGAGVAGVGVAGAGVAGVGVAGGVASLILPAITGAVVIMTSTAVAAGASAPVGTAVPPVTPTIANASAEAIASDYQDVISFAIASTVPDSPASASVPDPLPAADL